MTQSKHTPGPWTYIDRQMKSKNDAQKIDVHYLIYADSYKSGLGKNNNVARVYKLHETDHEANARLIAAAPELLEALEELLGWAHWANETLGMSPDPQFPEYKAGLKAIAKAKGDLK